MQQRSSFSAQANMEGSPIAVHFGAHVRLLRDRHALSQAEIVRHLGGWQQAAYSKVETGTRAPLFEQLEPIYRALRDAGVQPTMQDRDHFYSLARDLLSSRQRRHARQPDEAWNSLYRRLAAIDGLPMTRGTGSSPYQVLPQRKSTQLSPRREVGHLLGREEWLAKALNLVRRPSPIKVLVLQGPPGCGKTSELHRLIHHLKSSVPHSAVALSEPAPIQLERLEPKAVLEMLLGNLLEGIGSPSVTMPTSNLLTRINYLLGSLTKTSHPVVVGLDNAEHILDAQGHLEATWQRFLIQFVQAPHNATLIIASQEWPAGTFLGESQLITTLDVPPLSRREGAQLLQTLGLRNVSEELLEGAVERTGGIPVCLEWVTRLVREPFLRDEWSEFDERDESRVLARLLDDPAIFGGAVARRVHPLLDRVLRRLSDEAATTLQDLALSPVPLGAPALRLLYQSPKPLRELREASLLVAYPQRAQLLPMVAAQVQQSLSHDQVRATEGRVAEALRHWLRTSQTLDNREMGSLIAALAEIYLRDHRLLDASEFLIRHGWLAFKLGHARRLAQAAVNSIEETGEEIGGLLDVNQRCGSILLRYFLLPFLGHKIDATERVKGYQFIREQVIVERVSLQPPTEVAVSHHLIHSFIHQLRFQEALEILESCCNRLQPHLEGNPDLAASLLEKRAWLFGRWGEYAEEIGDQTRADHYQEQAIRFNEQIVDLVSLNLKVRSSLEQAFLKKRLARAFNNLGYHLKRIGKYEQACHAMEQSIDLKEQGYAEIDTLADAYGDQAQILASLGRFQEALAYDQKAFEEINRLAEAGISFAQAEFPTYQVNRGCLYLLLGRKEEAESLLYEAESHVQPERRMYQVIAQKTLQEIEQWQAHALSSHYQIDWQWVERYREFASFDSYWWWTPSGPFNEDEQAQWKQLFSPTMDEETKEKLGEILAAAREREFAVALSQQREPRFSYPALEISEVRRHRAGLKQLALSIEREEPNVLVRNLYRETIQEELDFLQMIEATHEGKNEIYWECSLRFTLPPTQEEMEYALSRVGYYVWQGLRQKGAEQASLRVQEVFERIGITFDLSAHVKEIDEGSELLPLSTGPRRLVTAQTAKRFFEAALQEAGYAEWRVIIDPNASAPRIEQGLRRIYLPQNRISLQQIKSDLSHELAGHVARCIAGERSVVGLLGIHTAHSLETEEGLATYYEMREAKEAGQPHDETAIWFGTLAVGLASGVITAPQAFLSIFNIFEALIYLYRLLRRPDQDQETASKFARKLALARCIRTFRGVPDLSEPGICYTKDALYLRGLWKIERALATDQSVLDRLAVGVVALEQLSDLTELGIVSSTQPLRRLAQRPDLDEYILSFELEETNTPEDQKS